MKVLIALIFLAIPGVAAAQSAKVDATVVSDCLTSADIGDIAPSCIGQAANACQSASADGSTTLGIVDCIRAETAIWDGLLNDVYQRVRDDMRVEDSAGGVINRADALRDAQRAWIAFRDADCALAYAQWQDGSIRSIVGANCHMTMTAQRTLELCDMRQGLN